MNIKASTKDLEMFLPHRYPMVWVDSVEVDLDAENNNATVMINKLLLYVSGEFIVPSSYIEWMAQGHGYAEALRYKIKYGDLERISAIKKVFMVGITGFEVFQPDVVAIEGCRFQIKTWVIRDLAPLQIVGGQVFVEQTGVLLASAKLKLYYN